MNGRLLVLRGLLKLLDFVTGYGVEIAMLIGVYRSVGMAGIVEDDMRAVNNRWKPDDALGDVIREVTAAALMRGVDVGCVEPMTLPVLNDRSTWFDLCGIGALLVV